MKFVNGWAFPDADRFMAAEMAADGTYQKRQLDGALQHVRNWRVAVDGGAHVGTWTKVLASRFGSVLAFEPSADTFEALAHNVQQFNLANVKILHQALGATSQRVETTLDGDAKSIQRGNTGARYVRPSASGVLCSKLDAFELDYVDFIKLDIEGSEVDALRGAVETLKRCKPVVLFEDKGHWLRFGHARKAPHTFLASIGAKHVARIGCDEVWSW